MSATGNRRILVVDDMASIHADFRKVLAADPLEAGLGDMEEALFGAPASPAKQGFDLDSAYQGQEALAMVKSALAEGHPYALAFVDMRMPPGWDGVETIEHLWQADEQLQVVICTAYSDHSWESVLARLDMRDRLLILKKPFDAIEVTQMARALTAKWRRTGELVQAREEAEQASRVKSQFIATMSHELRTPMNGVIGTIGILERSGLSAEQRKLLDMANHSARALMEIVDDILDFSKMEAGPVDVERAPLSVAVVIAEACARLADAARDNSVVLSSRLGADLPAAVFGDAARLRRVLVNLLGNAVKFGRRDGGSGRIEVRASVATDPAGRQQLEFAVEDDGIGMDAATQARLFRPFSQADSTATRRYGGIGLGLALARQLVAAMGGDIAVASAPQAGSIFTIRLPLEAAANPSPTPAAKGVAAVEAVAGLAAAAGPPGLILVAEDNPINQRIILAQLDLLGFHAEVAADGRKALARLREGNFALLITDLQMPEMDGFELARALRKESGRLGLTPIVALTANALGGESERCLAAGMNDYLTKPLLLSNLKTTIERWMNIAATTAPSLSVLTPSTRADDSAARDEPVDASVLPLLVGSDPRALAEFYLDFSESANEAAGVLAAAARAGRGAELVTAAHRLRGSARSIGAARLGDLCAQTEAAARGADLALVAPSLALLLEELAAVRAWIASRHAPAAAGVLAPEG